MPYAYTRDGERVTVSLHGELGHHEAIEMMQGIADIIHRELPGSLCLELTGLSFMDSSGIAVIVQTARRCRDIGADFEVKGTPPTAMRILKAAGIDRAVRFIQ